MKIRIKKFGCVEGKNISLYQLTNKNGMEVSVCNYGVTVTSITIPDSDKGKVNLVCGFDNLDGYFSNEFLTNAPYFGAIIGRYCATIQKGKYQDYELTKNNNNHNLHGGIKGFDKNVWAAHIEENKDDYCAVRFRLLSPDGDQGFPGNVLASVVISLNDKNELAFNYEATTDALTPFSMTNHTYFNLSGFEENVENHFVRINSRKIFPMDGVGNYEDLVLNIVSSDLDLRNPSKIGDVHKKIGDGIENFFLFDEGVTKETRHVAEITYLPKNRSLNVYTTEPGMLFYTAKYTSDQLGRENGDRYGKYRAFCCETHRIPNGPNIAGAKDVFLLPDETFKSETIYKLIF